MIFFKLTEGKFNNLGKSNLIYVLNRDNYVFSLDFNIQPTFCLENQYFDFETRTCNCKIILF